MNLALAFFLRAAQSAVNCRDVKFAQGKTWDMGCSYQHKAFLEKHARIRSLLRILHIKSNSFCGLRWGFISTVCF